MHRREHNPPTYPRWGQFSNETSYLNEVRDSALVLPLVVQGLVRRGLHGVSAECLRPSPLVPPAYPVVAEIGVGAVLDIASPEGDGRTHQASPGPGQPQLALPWGGRFEVRSFSTRNCCGRMLTALIYSLSPTHYFLFIFAFSRMYEGLRAFFLCATMSFCNCDAPLVPDQEIAGC